MISLSKWKEFGAAGCPSMKDSFASEPYEGMEKVIAYLENGKSVLSSPGAGIDFYTGERVQRRREILSDGEYTWSSMLPYYVRKYYLRLPRKFERKALES